MFQFMFSPANYDKKKCAYLSISAEEEFIVLGKCFAVSE